MPNNSQRPRRKKSLPETDFEKEILESIRRITRAIDINSQKLRQLHGITTPQLLCLSALHVHGKLSFSQLSTKVFLTTSTLTRIIDRLEARQYVRRIRNNQDRRVIHLEITSAGERVLSQAPSPLQEKLVEGLSSMSENERKQVRKVLNRLVDIMEAGSIQAAPILEVGAIQDPKSDTARKA